MPKDNIERAIAKGSGEGADAATFEAIVYEGYGPEGVAVIVEALTDNRTAPPPKCATRSRSSAARSVRPARSPGSSSGAASSSSRPAGVDEEELFMAAADAGAEDVERDGDVFQVTSAPENLAAVRNAIEAAGFTVESAELSMIPKTTVAVESESAAKTVMRLIEALEDDDDVQEVYANFDIPEQVLEAVAG